MELNELIQTVKSYTDSSEVESILTTAFQIASDAHKGFQRINGGPYMNHLLAVAAILAEWHAPLPVVAASLLHDILSPDYSREHSLDHIQPKLEPGIFRLVETAISLNSFIRDVEGGDFHSEADANDFRYRIASFLQQERDAVVIKIADRLHNLQTASALSRYFQERAAGVGMTLLAPLVDRLGMGLARRELENYCFEISNPMYYSMLKQHCTNASFHQEVEGMLEELRQTSSKLMSNSEIRWQPASFYTIGQDVKLGKSMHTESIPLRTLDGGSFIILTEEESDCYRILGILHKLYPPMKGQLRDFIGAPKENGYQSLHTRVKHSSGNLLHVIIRTHTMHLIAEYGITASWWNVPEELLPQLPKDIKPIDRETQVFTPKGEARYLPQGATVLDFAYHIHTDVGNHCVSPLVNGEPAYLYRPLRTGDRIEIILGGSDTGPSLAWLDYVQTPQAISRIRQWLTQHRRNEMAERGRMLLDTELQSLGLDSTDAQVHQLLTKLAAKENLEGMEDLLVSIGVGRHKAPKLVERLKTMRLKSVRSPDYIEPILDVHVLSPEEASLPRVFARCCGPEPPDTIVGYRRNDGILAIHKRTCAQIKELEKLIPVKWGTTPTEPNYIIVVEALNRPGLASDISTLVALLGVDMQSFSAYKRADGVMAEAHIYLGKTTSAQRNRIQKALEEAPYVNSVEIIHSSFLSTSTQQPASSRPIPLSNPYGPRLAEGSRFYGREIECERISALLRDQSQNTAVLLWGQKRIGKTSLLLRLKERSQGDFFPVYIDMQGLKDSSTTQFLYQLMRGISQVLQDNIPDLVQEISVPYLNRLRKDPLAYFDTFMARLQEITQSHPLVVILDEFQCLCSLWEEVVSRDAIFSRLRSRSQHGRGIHLVLSGGGLLSQLTDQCGIASLFNITHDVKLGYLEIPAAQQLIKDGLIKIGNISDFALDLLLDLTAGHPFYLQLLCSRLYEQAQESKTMITYQFARQSIQEWIGKADKSRFQHLWEGYDTTSAQRNKLILSAIAQFRAKEVEYDRLAGAICSVVSEQDLVRSLEDLIDLGVLKHNHSNYAIEVELFARWLRDHWPLELTLKEAR